MARLAIYASHSTNAWQRFTRRSSRTTPCRSGTASIRSASINKTNGITQRRWLALCNRELAAFATERVGKGWMTELTDLKGLEKYANDVNSLRQLQAIKKEKKNQLILYVLSTKSNHQDSSHHKLFALRSLSFLLFQPEHQKGIQLR